MIENWLNHGAPPEEPNGLRTQVMTCFGWHALKCRGTMRGSFVNAASGL